MLPQFAEEKVEIPNGSMTARFILRSSSLRRGHNVTGGLKVWRENLKNLKLKKFLTAIEEL